MPAWLSSRWDRWITTEQEPGRYPFDRGAIRIYRAGLWLAPSWWLIDTRRSQRTEEREQNETACYVMFWFAALIVFWLISPNDDTAAQILGAVALFRLIEITLTVLGFVLDRREPKIARSLITIGILALQVALIFAIVDHSFARLDFLRPGSTVAHEHPATTPFEYFYLSWTYMTTLGNQYTPKTEFASALQLAANTWGLLLLGIVVARAIAIVDETKKKVLSES